MTIQQTVDIPPSREVLFKIVVPETVPCGRRNVILDFPQDTGQSFTQQRTRRPPDPELAAIMKEAAEKAERRRTDPVYRAEVAKILRELQEGGPIFGNRDGMDVQREMRNEWPD